MTRADLARLVRFEPGAPLRLTEVREAIKRLYGTGQYSNIEVDTEPAPNGVGLVIRTTEQWFVGPVEVQGKVRVPPNEGQLANATRLELGAPFNEEDLQTAQKGVSDLLQRNGLYLAKVDPKVDRDPEHQQVSLTFQVDAGKRARLTTPTITGDTRIPPADIAKATKYKGWFRWKQATDQQTQSGIQNIRKRYDKEERLTAAVTLDHMDYDAPTNRVRPTIQTASGPKVKIKTSGAKVSKGNLQKYVPVFDEETVNRDLLVSGVRNLRDYFQNQGYFDVQVDFQTTEPNPDEQDITYTIALGERHKVVKIDIQGNHYFTTDQIRERMFLQPAGVIRLRHGRYTEGFARRDEDSVKALYRDNGFRDAKVAAVAHDDYQGKKGEVAVTLTIDEGAQYLVSNLTVDGITREDKSAILARLASSVGQPFSDTSVALDRDSILTLYQSTGYPDTTFEYSGVPGPGPHEMSLHYTIVEGSPRFVRDVLITGLHTTRHRLVDPNVLLKPGDPLAWTEMGRMQRRLYNLGVFDKVDMAIQNPDGDTQNKYVIYHLTEGNRYSAAVGVGAEIARIGGSQTSLNNPAGATGFAPRGDLEVARLNLWGLGHSLAFKSRYSTLDRRVSLSYLAPRFHNVDGRNISVTALYDNTRDVLTFTARRLEGSTQLSQKLSKATTVLWRYTWRNVKVDPNTLKITPGLIPLASQPARVAMISGNLIQDRRDDPVDAHRGYYNTVDLGLVEHYFGGNTNFVRFLARNSYYKRLFADVVFASNTEFGWIHPFNLTAGVEPVPIAERFFGGGSTSHRGFPDNQAGPRDEMTGFPLGGNALFLHSTEARFPFLGDNIQGVLFHDMGNLYSSVRDISFRTSQNGLTDFNYMVHAAGFGIRYKTPVGPVRLDLAYSINPPTFNGLKGSYQDLLFGRATPTIQSVSHFQFFFSIGQAF
ncbi:MAG TPA: POTRA domain-containing protein [Bryobacteraceae bacterium]|nr:POTRA domain-containing protein [Bryobacteraceae bacterium]